MLFWLKNNLLGCWLSGLRWMFWKHFNITKYCASSNLAQPSLLIELWFSGKTSACQAVYRRFNSCQFIFYFVHFIKKALVQKAEHRISNSVVRSSSLLSFELFILLMRLKNNLLFSLKNSILRGKFLFFIAYKQSFINTLNLLRKRGFIKSFEIIKNCSGAWKIKVFLRPSNFQTSFLEFKTKNLSSKILATKKRLSKNFNKDICITKPSNKISHPSFFTKSTIKIIR